MIKLLESTIIFYLAYFSVPNRKCLHIFLSLQPSWLQPVPSLFMVLQQVGFHVHFISIITLLFYNELNCNLKID
jgi:hypothetical protein